MKKSKTRLLAIFMTVLGCSMASAQTLSLDSCRAMALRNNKQLSISRAQEEVARNVRKSAKTKYLPHVDIAAAYMFTSKEINLLSDEQKGTISNIGTAASSVLSANSGTAEQMITSLVKKGLISPQEVPAIQKSMALTQQSLEAYGNALGAKIVEAFDTDTRNMFIGSIMLNQPLYMGGAITAGNRMAEIAERIAAMKTETAEHEVLYNIDQTYWMVVSLNKKKQLADSYLTLVKKLDADVQKMIKEGVATRADGLKVSVRVNEADMTKTQVESGLSLSRMLLCQLCGLPLDSDITLADENSKELAADMVEMQYDMSSAMEQRPELRMVNESMALSQQAVKMARAAYLPQLMLTGGYSVHNPNVYNGFHNKFAGVWNVGVMLRMPVWDWGEARYKVRSAKTNATIATLTKDELQEKIELQVNQCDYKLQVAKKRLMAAQQNQKVADENLRCATLGFKEGVMSTTEVMAAQTAWFQAQTQNIDAQIDVKLGEAGLKKALGI